MYDQILNMSDHFKNTRIQYLAYEKVIINTVIMTVGSYGYHYLFDRVPRIMKFLLKVKFKKSLLHHRLVRYVAVLGRNRTLFCCVFPSCSAVLPLRAGLIHAM